MFKLSQSTSFFWPVTVNLPADGGRFEKATFDAQFRRVSQADLKAMKERIEAGELTDEAFVREVLTGWRGITDDGAEVPYSESALAQLLDVPTVAASVVLAFVQANSGLVAKN